MIGSERHSYRLRAGSFVACPQENGIKSEKDMSQEFKIVISTPADPTGATATVFVAATDATGAADRLAQAAALTPETSLESLAASARWAQANAGAARQPMAALANAPEDFLSKLEVGFGTDFQGKIIAGVEQIGQAFTEALQRGLEPGGGRQPIAAGPGAFPGRGQREPSPESAPANARSGNAVDDTLEGQRGTGQDTGRHPRADDGEARAQTRSERHPHAGHAAADHRAADRGAARPHSLSQAPARRRGERDTFTIHGDQDGGLHTGGLSTGGLSSGASSGGLPLTDALGRTFGDPAAALAGAPSYVPSFPTAAASLAPAMPTPPSLTLGTGASANDPFSAAAGKFGDSAKGGLDKAAHSLDGLSQTLLSGFESLGQRLQKVETDVRNALSQNENRA